MRLLRRHLTRCRGEVPSSVSMYEWVGALPLRRGINISKQYVRRQLRTQLVDRRAAGMLDKGGEILLDAFGYAVLDLNGRVQRTGLPRHVMASMLLIPELESAIGRHMGGQDWRASADGTGPID